MARVPGLGDRMLRSDGSFWGASLKVAASNQPVCLRLAPGHSHGPAPATASLPNGSPPQQQPQPLPLSLPQPQGRDVSLATRAYATSSAIGSVVMAASAVSLARRTAAAQQPSVEKGPSAESPEGRPASLAHEVAPPRLHSTAEGAIQVIATDVDGTLLDSRQQLSERNERALRLAMEQGVQVVLATGKARGPWVPEVMRRLQLDTPAVFLQGLMVCSADGTVIYERTLEEDLARDIVDVAESRELTLVAYCGDRILCAETNAHTDRLIGYGEPIPEAVGPLSDMVGAIPMHKMLFMADDATLAGLRRQLEGALAGRATLTTALHGMLEVLPLGASKAGGLARVLSILGVPEAAMMAAGDGENDIEMLRMAGVSVAMGNASAQVKSEAHYIAKSNDQDGLAHAVERFVLKPGFWCWD